MDFSQIQTATLLAYGFSAISMLIMIGYVSSASQPQQQDIATETNLDSQAIDNLVTTVEKSTKIYDETARAIEGVNDLLITVTRRLDLERNRALVKKIKELINENDQLMIRLLEEEARVRQNLDNIDSISLPDSPQDTTIAENVIPETVNQSSNFSLFDFATNALNSIVDFGSAIIGFFIR